MSYFINGDFIHINVAFYSCYSLVIKSYVMSSYMCYSLVIISSLLIRHHTINGYGRDLEYFRGRFAGRDAHPSHSHTSGVLCHDSCEQYVAQGYFWRWVYLSTYYTNIPSRRAKPLLSPRQHCQPI